MDIRKYAEAKSKAKCRMPEGEFSCAADAMDASFSHGFDAGYEYAMRELRQEKTSIKSEYD